MESLQTYTAEKMISETIKGGPAFYRPAHLTPDPLARLRAARPEDAPATSVRILSIRLPWLFAIIKLPGWSPIGMVLER
jgi:hypothetical protein